MKIKKYLEDKLKSHILEDRLNEVIKNNFFLQEIETLNNLNNGYDYYRYVINNINLNKLNTNNSYIMWIVDKVDILDKNKACKIIPQKVSMPDIDTDFDINYREDVIQYIRDRYGVDRVGQVATFGSLKGRGAIRETLRVHEVCDKTTMDKISKLFPDEAKIQDELEEQKETSIIRYVLRNTPELVSDYCQMDSSGNLTGEYAKYFEQAIRIEGTYKSYGKHASALILGYKPLKEICPLIADKSGEQEMAGVEFEFLEEMGMVKMDILGLSTLSKLAGINELLKKPYINNNKENEDENE